MNLSIIIPSIRTNNWPDLIDSIQRSSTKYSFEIIFVGPSYNSHIEEYSNIKFVKDLGSANRCQQIGSLLAEGDYIHFGSDDCMYMENTIDSVMDKLYGHNKIITCNYSEGGNSQNTMSLVEAYGNNLFKEIIDSWVYFNAFFMNTFIFRSFSFNCIYETTCWGHTDLAARIQNSIMKKNYHTEIEIHKDTIFECSHMPNTSGDHAPIHYAFFEDRNKFYHSKLDSTILNFNDVPLVWKKRFK